MLEFLLETGKNTEIQEYVESVMAREEGKVALGRERNSMMAERK